MTKTLNTFNSLIEAVKAQGWQEDENGVHELGAQADVKMADYKVMYLRFYNVGCHGNMVQIFGSVSYAAYENGDENVHWSVYSRAQKFVFGFSSMDVEEAQKVVKATMAKLTRAAAKGAGKKLAEFNPFIMDSEDKIHINRHKDDMEWYIAMDAAKCEHAIKVEEDV